MYYQNKLFINFVRIQSGKWQEEVAQPKLTYLKLIGVLKKNESMDFGPLSNISSNFMSQYKPKQI